jgi:hypothetical protein
MELTKNMQELKENITASSGERVKELTRIKGEAKAVRQEAVEKIKDFSTARGESGRKLKRDLAQSKTERKKEVAQSRKTAQGMVQDFHDSRMKNGERLRKDLTQGGKLLVQNEKKRKQEVGKMLETFRSELDVSASEIKKEITESKAKTIAEVKEALADARTMVDSFQSSRQTMAAELKNDLGKSGKERKESVSDLRRGFRQVQAEIQADLKGAADAWQGTGPAKRKKSSGSKSAAEVPAEVLAETPAETPVEAPAEMSPNLEEKLLTIINQHTEGITLSEVARELGLVTIVLGKTAKVLLDQGKVRREEKNYYPAGV